MVRDANKPRKTIYPHLELNLEARVAAVLGLVVCRGNWRRRRAHGDITVCV